MLWLGAGQIGMAIAGRVGLNQKIIVGDKNIENSKTIAKIMLESGLDIEPVVIYPTKLLLTEKLIS